MGAVGLVCYYVPGLATGMLVIPPLPRAEAALNLARLEISGVSRNLFIPGAVAPTRAADVSSTFLGIPFVSTAETNRPPTFGGLLLLYYCNIRCSVNAALPPLVSPSAPAKLTI